MATNKMSEPKAESAQQYADFEASVMAAAERKARKIEAETQRLCAAALLVTFCFMFLYYHTILYLAQLIYLWRCCRTCTEILCSGAHAACSSAFFTRAAYKKE